MKTGPLKWSDWLQFKWIVQIQPYMYSNQAHMHEHDHARKGQLHRLHALESVRTTHHARDICLMWKWPLINARASEKKLHNMVHIEYTDCSNPQHVSYRAQLSSWFQTVSAFFPHIYAPHFTWITLFAYTHSQFIRYMWRAVVVNFVCEYVY